MTNNVYLPFSSPMHKADWCTIGKLRTTPLKYPNPTFEILSIVGGRIIWPHFCESPTLGVIQMPRAPSEVGWTMITRLCMADSRGQLGTRLFYKVYMVRYTVPPSGSKILRGAHLNY